jgi:hypothetical protein
LESENAGIKKSSVIQVSIPLEREKIICKEQDMARTDYVPASYEKFTIWLDNLVAAVIMHTTGSNSDWTHIKAADVDELVDNQSKWNEVQALVVSDPTSNNRKERKRVRKVVEKYARGFVKEYMHSKIITDAQRDEIGVPNPKPTRAKVPKPTTSPAFYRITPKSSQRILFHFRDEIMDAGRAIPLGYGGAILNYTYGPAKVTDRSLIKNRLLMTSSPFLLDLLPQEAETMWLSCFVQWQTESGEEGPPSEVYHVVVL